MAKPAPLPPPPPLWGETARRDRALRFIVQARETIIAMAGSSTFPNLNPNDKEDVMSVAILLAVARSR